MDSSAKTDPARALQRLRDLVANNPNDDELIVRLTVQLFELGQTEEVGEWIDKLDQRGFLEPNVARIKAQLSLRQRAESTDIPSLRRAAENAPKDFGAVLKLAEALAGSEEYEEACELGIFLVSNDLKLTGEKARELMVELFAA